MRSKWQAIPIVAVVILAVWMAVATTPSAPDPRTVTAVLQGTDLSPGTNLSGPHPGTPFFEASAGPFASVAPIPPHMPTERQASAATDREAGIGTNADGGAGSDAATGDTATGDTATGDTATGDTATGDTVGESNSHCDTGAWPKVTADDPIRPGAPAGVYLSEHGTRIKLAVTHPGTGSVQFNGSVTTDGTLEIIPVMLEKHDRWNVSTDGHTLTFDFDNHGLVDGIDITSVCGSYLTIEATFGNIPALLRNVRVSVVPDQSLATPFTITRRS